MTCVLNQYSEKRYVTCSQNRKAVLQTDCGSGELAWRFHAAFKKMALVQLNIKSISRQSRGQLMDSLNDLSLSDKKNKSNKPAIKHLWVIIYKRFRIWYFYNSFYYKQATFTCVLVTVVMRIDFYNFFTELMFLHSGPQNLAFKCPSCYLDFVAQNTKDWLILLYCQWTSSKPNM